MKLPFKVNLQNANRRTVAGIGFLVITVLASASLFATGPDAKPTARVEKAWPVSIIDITPGELNPTFSAYGRVESNNIAHIRTDLVAQVKHVHVREGDWVAQGQVLIELSDREALLKLKEREADLAENRARLESIKTEFDLQKQSTQHYESMQRIAQATLKRHEDLMAEGLISQSLLDEVLARANQVNIDFQAHMRMLADFPNKLAGQNAQVRKNEALADQARIDLEKAVVTAPFDGPVLRVMVAPGDRSNIGLPLLEIAEADGFEIRVQVPETYTDRFGHYLDQGVEVTAHGAGQRLVLSRLASEVKHGQSGLDAFFRLRVIPGKPLPALGRVIDIEVRLPVETNVVALPVQSLYENQRVYRVENDRLQSIEVERIGEMTAPDGSYRVLVRSAGLESGQKIITTALPRPISGLLVSAANG
ncbi:MAG: HlyD family efflux transporter periplasmic adaptor subunit [Proteobacteria bacterium]|nr:HlyD family efflux transporter periplasmic adaptor subunit [Pseudomonadota bacterium]